MSDEPDEQQEEKDGRPTQNEDGQWVCPECGEAYRLAIQLGAHRKSKHGVSGSSRSTRQAKERKQREGSPQRSRGVSAQQERKRKIAKALRDLADLSEDLRGHGGGKPLPERLAVIIREDADALATLIASAAEHVNPVAFFVDRALWLVAPLTGSQRVLRWLLRAWRNQIQAEQEDGVPVPFEMNGQEAAEWRADLPAPITDPLLVETGTGGDNSE